VEEGERLRALKAPDTEDRPLSLPPLSNFNPDVSACSTKEEEEEIGMPLSSLGPRTEAAAGEGPPLIVVVAEEERASR